jgi:hypothetical protein
MRLRCLLREKSEEIGRVVFLIEHESKIEGVLSNAKDKGGRKV